MRILHTDSTTGLDVMIVNPEPNQYNVVATRKGKQTHMLQSDNYEKAKCYCDGVIDGFKILQVETIQDLRNLADIARGQ